jgi:putative aldouronate transport system substrate-binding protein
VFNYVTEWAAKFVVGDYDINAKWDEFLDGLDSMGAYEIAEVYQTAYDRYKAS